jgi:hypothetical protein
MDNDNNKYAWLNKVEFMGEINLVRLFNTYKKYVLECGESGVEPEEKITDEFGYYLSIYLKLKMQNDTFQVELGCNDSEWTYDIVDKASSSNKSIINLDKIITNIFKDLAEDMLMEDWMEEMANFVYEAEDEDLFIDY